MRPKQEPQPYTQLSTVMVLTCGSDGARQSRVQQPQQLGALTVDATECGSSVHVSFHSRSEQTTHPSEAAAAWPWVVGIAAAGRDAGIGHAVASRSVARAPSSPQTGAAE